MKSAEVSGKRLYGLQGGGKSRDGFGGLRLREKFLERLDGSIFTLDSAARSQSRERRLVEVIRRRGLRIEGFGTPPHCL